MSNEQRPSSRRGTSSNSRNNKQQSSSTTMLNEEESFPKDIFKALSNLGEEELLKRSLRGVPKIDLRDEKQLDVFAELIAETLIKKDGLSLSRSRKSDSARQPANFSQTEGFYTSKIESTSSERELPINEKGKQLKRKQVIVSPCNSPPETPRDENDSDCIAEDLITIQNNRLNLFPNSKTITPTYKTHDNPKVNQEVEWYSRSVPRVLKETSTNTDDPSLELMDSKSKQELVSSVKRKTQDDLIKRFIHNRIYDQYLRQQLSNHEKQLFYLFPGLTRKILIDLERNIYDRKYPQYQAQNLDHMIKEMRRVLNHSHQPGEY